VVVFPFNKSCIYVLRLRKYCTILPLCRFINQKSALLGGLRFV